MKRLSRGRSATSQAVTNTGKTDLEGKRQALGRKDSIGSHQSVPVPQSRSSVELHLKTRRLSDFHFEKTGWIDTFPTTQPTAPMAVPTKDVPNSDVKNIPGAHEPARRTRKESPPLRSFLRSHSPAKSMMTMTRGRKSSFSSSSTLFESSSAVPITIVVTTPDEEHPGDVAGSSGGGFPGPSIRKFRNDSTMSLPAIGSQSGLDRNRLMPPIDPQVDTRRMRKAREFEDIRHFLIGFLNTKGSQLPRQLRTRIMSVYGITDADLDPRIVAKFGGEGADLDEGIVLDLGLQQGAIPTDRDHKRILDMAFQSILPSATPSSAQELLAARRKSLAMPLRSGTGTGTASLYSLDSNYSGISSRMSLTANSKSKQTLDSIISNRALLQSTKRPTNLAPAATSAASPPASPKAQAPSFFRRRSLQVYPTYNSTPTIVSSPQQKVPTPSIKPRPQSLYRNRTDPLPVKAPVALTVPPPALNHPTNFSKSRHLKSESSPAIPSLSHRPTVSSQLTRSPLTASFPQRPLSLVRERSTPSIELDSFTANFSDQETEKDDSPTESLDELYMKSSWIAPLIDSKTPPPQESKPSPPPQQPKPTATQEFKPTSPKLSPSSAPRESKASPPKVSQPSPPRESKASPPKVSQPSPPRETKPLTQQSKSSSPPKPTPRLRRMSKPIPKALNLAPSPTTKEHSLPSPVEPTHTLTHKPLTVSEVSDIEKPFYVRSRRSSSTLDAVSPKTPTFGSVGGYESDSSGLFFPVHPAFAPLGKERSAASMRVEERKREEKWGTITTVSVQPAGKSKSKKDKRGSMFGNLKRSIFGK